MSSLNRRRFLEDSLLASAAAIAASAGANAFAAEKDKEKEQPAQSGSAADRLSVAVVGVNGRGVSHLDAFSGRKDTEVTYVCDADLAVAEKRADEVAKKQNGRRPKVEQDIRKVLEDKSVDVVSTATPNHWHALISIWSIQAGKDVYVEKPVSHNVWEGRQIVEAARKYNKIVQTGTQCRSTKAHKEAVAFINAGKIGEVNVARGLCYKKRGSIGARGEYKVPASVNYDLWAGPAPLAPLTRPKFHYDWHWQWPTGNGDLGNQGIHEMDVARWGLGVQGLGQSVLGFGARLAYEDAGDTYNTMVTVHEFGPKTLIFEVRGLSTKDYKGSMVGNVFYGKDGYVVMTGYGSGAAFDTKGEKLATFSGGDDHFGNFLKAVRSRKIEDLNADILEGHQSSALCHLGNISAKLGESLTLGEIKDRLAAQPHSELTLETFDRLSTHLADNKLDASTTKLHFGPRLTLEGEKFVGPSAERANPLLTREYRAPYVVPPTV